MLLFCLFNCINIFFINIVGFVLMSLRTPSLVHVMKILPIGGESLVKYSTLNLD